MAVRLTFEVEFSVSSDVNDLKDLGNGKYTVRTASMSEGGSWLTRVVAGAIDTQYQLDNIATARFLYLRVKPVDENDPAPELQIKFNDIANTPTILKPPDDKKVGMLLVTTDSLTALYVSNPGAQDAELTIVVAGD